MDWYDRSSIKNEMSRQTSRIINEMREQEVRAERHQELNVLLTKAEDYRDRYIIEGNPRLLELANDYANRATALADQWEKEALRESRRGGCLLWLLVLFVGWFFLPASLWLYPLFFLWWLKNYVIFRSRYWPKREKKENVTASPARPSGSIRYVKSTKGLGSLFLKDKETKTQQVKRSMSSQIKQQNQTSQPVSEEQMALVNIEELMAECDQLDQQKEVWLEHLDQQIIRPVQETGTVNLDDFLALQKEGETLRQAYQDLVETAAGDPRIDIDRSEIDDFVVSFDEVLDKLQGFLPDLEEHEALKKDLAQLEQQKKNWMKQIDHRFVLPVQETGKVDVDTIQTLQEEGRLLRHSYQDFAARAAHDPRIDRSEIDDCVISFDEVLDTLQGFLPDLEEHEALKKDLAQLEQQRKNWMKQIDHRFVLPVQETGEVDVDAIQTLKEEGRLLRQSYQDLAARAAHDPQIEVSGVDELVADIDELLTDLQNFA